MAETASGTGDDVRRLTVPAGAAGRRLDLLLVEALDLPRTRVRALFEAGRVALDGRPVAKGGAKARPGASVEVSIPPPGPPDPDAPVPAPDVPLVVLHEEPDVVVVEKPAGVVVHPAPGNRTGTLVEAVVGRYPEMARVGSERRPGVVHRLDKETSGAIAFARTNRAYYALVEQLRRRTLRRVYLAVAGGVVEADEGTIDAPIGRDARDRKRMAVRPVEEGGRPARTRFRVLERFRGTTLLEVALETGRTHQIRVHLAAIGHPVVGDSTYARRRTIEFPRQALHAARLEYVSPATGGRVGVESPLPADIRGLLDRLRAG